MSENTETIDLLVEMEKLVSSFSDINSYEMLLENIKVQIEKLVPHDTCGLYFYDENEHKLKLFYTKGFSQDEIINAENTALERHPGLVYRTGEIFWVNNQGEENNPISIDPRKNAHTGSRLHVPVMLKDQIIGDFGIQSHNPFSFTEKHVTIMRFFSSLAAHSYTLIKQNKINKDLNIENEKLSFLAKSSFDNVVFTDREGNITWVNETFENNTGWKMSEILGRKPGHFLGGKKTEIEKVIELRLAIQKGLPCNTIITNYSKTGREYKVSIQLNPIYDQDGEVISFIAVQHDVTKAEEQKEILRQARLELQENYESILDLKEQYAEIVQTTDELITQIDNQGTILFVNHSWLQKLGYKESEVIGSNLFAYIHPDFHQHCTEIFHNLNKHINEDFPVAYFVVSKNGKKIELDGFVKVTYKEGNLLYVRSHLRDVTESNRLKKAKELRTETLARRNQILAEISSINFLEYPNSEEATRKISELVAQGFDVARVSIWDFKETFIFCRNLFERYENRHSNGMILNEEDFSAYFEAIKSQLVIVADNAQTHPATSCFSSSYLIPLGITSMLDIPIKSNNILSGILCFEHIGEGKTWSEDDISYGKAIADTISVIEESRKRLDVEKTFTLLFDKSADPILLLDENLKCMDCNASTLAFLGFENKSFFLEQELNAFFPERQSDGALSLEKLKAMNLNALKFGSSKFEFEYFKSNGVSVSVEVMMTLIERMGKNFYYTVWRDITDRILAQTALLESRKRLEAIMNSLNETVWGIRLPDNSLQYISPSAELLYEIPQSSWPDNVNFWFDVIHPDDKARVKEESASLFASGKANMEYRIITPDKKVKWIFSNCQIIKNEQDVPVLLTGISGDITARKLIEIELRNYKIAIDESAIVSITDNLGKITYANDKFIEISKYSKDEILGKSHRIINSSFHPKAYFEGMWEVISKGEIWKGEIKNKAKDGSFYWVKSTILPFMKDGKPYQFMALRYDITERVEAKNEMEAQKLFYENILNNIPGNVAVFSEDGKYLFVNPNTIKDPVLREWIIGKDNYDYCRYRGLSMELADNRENDFATLRSNGYMLNSMEKRLLPNEKFSYLSSTMNIYNYKGKNFIAAYGLDITALKEAEEILNLKNEELLVINKKLEQLALDNQELEQNAYLASHDLKEPLRTVENYIQLLQEEYEDQLDDQAKKYIGTVIAAISRMNRLIKTILEFSRLGINRSLSIVDCGNLIGGVLLDLETMIKETAAQVHVSEMPMINLYESEMRQLFENLIVNAIKFRKKDEIPVIHIESKKITEGWQFLVRDNGIGIAPEHFKRVFEIFQRLHTIKQYEGSGIGLANSKKIVQMHLGEIWVESNIGEGSSFYFTIQNL